MTKLNCIKRLAFIAIAAMAITVSANAQETFSKGTKIANLGIGLGSTLGGTGYSSSVPPISLSLDYCIIDGMFNVDKLSLGVGGYVGYTSNSYKFSTDWKLTYNYIIPGVRGTFHYEVSPKFDVYAGLMLGYQIITDNFDGNDEGYITKNSTFYASEFIGARYYLNDNLAGFCELGYGIAWFNLGLSLKF